MVTIPLRTVAGVLKFFSIFVFKHSILKPQPFTYMCNKSNRVYHDKGIRAFDSGGFSALFRDIVDKDYHGKVFGFSTDVLDMICIDHDRWELSRSRQHDKTMDCSTVIGSYNYMRQSFSNDRHLLIELKLNCKQHNLGKNDYTGKINHSGELLYPHIIYDKKIFLFYGSAKGKAKKDVSQWQNGTKGSEFKNILIMNPEEFNNYIGFTDQFPYQPINNASQIENDINNNTADIDNLFDVLQKWLDISENYGRLYNLNERRHIAEAALKALKNISLENRGNDYRTTIDIFIVEFEKFID